MKRSYEPDVKPRRRLVLPNRDYLALVRSLLAKYPTCELCRKNRSESAHHCVAKSQSGDDVLENLVALCGDGVRKCHGEVEHSREARSRLRAKLRPETLAYALERKGQGWLDVRYPESP